MKKSMGKVKQFIVEVQSELGKMSWPDQKSIVGSTGVVIISTVFMLVFLWIMDIIFSEILRLIFR